MATVSAKYLGDLRVECVHNQSGTKIITDAPSDNQGKGEAFSPTDLCATALGACAMELLEQLESQVEALLARLDRLKAENAKISAESADVAAENDALEKENQKLRESLENEETLRTEALNRIDALLHRIQEHDSVE